MLTEWERWSRTCPEKHDPAACREKWQSFSNKPGGVGVGTLVAMAREDVESADRETKLKLLREKLKVPGLTEIRRIGTTHATYELVTDKGERVDLGTIKNMRSIANVSDAIIETLALDGPTDRRGWRSILVLIRQVATQVDAGDHDPMAVWLEQFETENHVREWRGNGEIGSKEWWDNMLIKIARQRFPFDEACFRCEKGFLWFTVRHLLHFLNYDLKVNITDSELRAALVRFGCVAPKSPRRAMREDGRWVKPYLWHAPHSDLVPMLEPLGTTDDPEIGSPF